MKKIVLLFVAGAIATSAMAQKKNIQSALNSLRNKEYSEAVQFIDMATKDESTKDDPKAWFVRGNIYMTMQVDPGYKDSNPYRKAAESYIKVVELKDSYEEQQVSRQLYNSALLYYNDGANTYNEKKYDESFDLSGMVVKIHDLGKGGRFNQFKAFDTIAAQAQFIQALSAYNDNKYEKAIPILEQLKANPIKSDPNTYLLLATSYKMTKQNDKLLSLIQEGRQKFPNDVNLRNEELNYYINAGKQDELLGKLKAAVESDPTNAELLYNLANVYNSMAFNQEGGKPENYEELITKAEENYLKAIAISPDNFLYNYNTGAMYYNQGTEINKEMNAIEGTSAAEQKKYDALLKQREAYFEKALPYLEKTYTLIEPNLASASADDKNTYVASVQAAREIYARQNKLDKSAELKKKLENLPK